MINASAMTPKRSPEEPRETPTCWERWSVMTETAAQHAVVRCLVCPGEGA